MADKMLHIVRGATGQYSDQREWLVAAYEDESEARAHERAADIRAKDFEKARCPHDEKMNDWCEPCGRNGYDEAAIRAWMGDLDPEALSMDYTGTSYFTSTVPIRDRAPSPGAAPTGKEG